MNSRGAKAMLAVTVGIGAFSLVGTSASALEPVAGCGEGYELLPIEATLLKIDERPYVDRGTWDEVQAGVTALDINGDGYLCSKRLPSNSGQDKKSGYDGHWSTGICDNRAAGRV